MPEDPNNRNLSNLGKLLQLSANLQIMREPERAFENFGEHFSHVELLENAASFK